MTHKKSKNPNPSVLTPAAIEAAVKASESLLNDNCIAACIGVQPHVICAWRKRAVDGEEPYAELFSRIARKRAERDVELVEKIYEAEDWKAAAWLLERRNSDYNLKSRVEHTGADGQGIIIQVQGVVTDNPYSPDAND